MTDNNTDKDAATPMTDEDAATPTSDKDADDGQRRRIYIATQRMSHDADGDNAAADVDTAMQTMT